jgi:hypothetical protein
MPTIAKPSAGEDVRKLHNYVRELVNRTNALLNMTAKVEGRIIGFGGLEVSGSDARLKIYAKPTPGLGGTNKRPIGLTISSSQNPVEYGGTVFWGAVLGATDAKGTIQFYIDGGAFGGPIDVAGGSVASPTITGGSQLSVGNHIIQASFSGDAQYFPVSASLIQVVHGLNRPTVAAFGNPNPAVAGDNTVYPPVPGDKIFLGANVTAQNPIPPAPNITGYVRFFVNGRNVGDFPLVFLSGQTWRAVTGNKAAEFGVGNTQVQAMYLGDNNYGSATDTYTQTVKALSKVSLTIDPNPVQPDHPISFYVSVSGTAGKPVPTGTVSLSVSGVPYLSPQNLSNGQTTFYVPNGLPVGQYALAAYYGGDSRYAVDYGDVVTLIVRVEDPVPASIGIFPGFSKSTVVVITFEALNSDGSHFDFNGPLNLQATGSAFSANSAPDPIIMQFDGGVITALPTIGAGVTIGVLNMVNGKDTRQIAIGGFPTDYDTQASANFNFERRGVVTPSVYFSWVFI